ncbi:alcohol dehydrogenase [Venturia nashicola]|nr:alcohol dehydrogenase [Venturia nashicola]
MALPAIQKAAVKVGKGATSRVEIKDVAMPRIEPGQILVKISYSGLCGSDKMFYRDETPSGVPMMQEASLGISGHEGAGEVVEIADDVEHLWTIGDRVGIKYIASTCRRCEFCTNGLDEVCCPKSQKSGANCPGTFQEHCATDARYATRIPDGVTDEEAGPIMCGGVSMYAALKKSNVEPGQWIVIQGAGGGCGHFGIQYAKAMGMRVIAVDGGAAKRPFCLDHGAEHYIDFNHMKDIPAEVKRITTYGSHGVIVVPPTREAYESAPLLIRPRGTMVCVGLPGDADIRAGPHPAYLARNNLKIVGSMCGSLKETEEALAFTVRGLVKPVLTIGEMKDLDRFMDEMAEGKVAGRIVIKVTA